MPSTGVPASIAWRSATSSPDALMLFIALPAAPTPGKITRSACATESRVVGDARRQSDLGARALHTAQIAGVVVDDDRHRS